MGGDEGGVNIYSVKYLHVHVHFIHVHVHVLCYVNHMFMYLMIGREDDDHRLITDAEEGRSLEINNPGAYPTCCVELSLDGLAVNTVLQSSHINDYEGASGTSISFDWAPQVRHGSVVHVRIPLYRCTIEIRECELAPSSGPFPIFQCFTQKHSEDYNINNVDDVKVT